MSENGKSPAPNSFPWKEVLGFLGVVVVALIGYFGTRYATDVPIHATQTAQAEAATQTHEVLSTSAAETSAAIQTPTGPSPTALTASPLPPPRIYDFAACLDPCNGSNALTTFLAKTTLIHLTWKYENIPLYAVYVRSYEQEQEGGGGWLTWLTNDCTWTKPPSGSYDVSVFDGTGLGSGNWRITIAVNGVNLLQRIIFIQGHWKSWHPQGIFPSCE